MKHSTTSSSNDPFLTTFQIRIFKNGKRQINYINKQQAKPSRISILFFLNTQT